ncbi:hypothetical protein CALVIDRAFT_582219 [Calocera viscosa TUFC12733]|uniref:DUF6535 domain-containing protein n=1 Tax=Calocera viscosa (strain TUFC12733) TaxID=1330018 RepID=A0A167JVG9_CALVF|nr:hypothetical protein CALVIDRAFT_582219 [Calocera viscosa TUFC12733]
MNPSETIRGAANEHPLPPAKIIYNETPQEGRFVYDIAPDLSHAEDAPVWNVYRKHAAVWDKNYLDSLDDTLNVFLLFATLFSAVVAPFLIASYVLLQPDSQQATLDALAVISAQLAAGGNGGQAPAAYAGESSSDASFGSLSVNALWVISLLLSLISTVFAVSVKQWLTTYKERLPADSLACVRERHERYVSLERWKISVIVNALPMVINLAVFIFLAGLVVYMWQTSNSIGALLCGLLVASVCLFIGITLLPFLWPRCPYQSLLTKTLVDSLYFTEKHQNEAFMDQYPPADDKGLGSKTSQQRMLRKIRAGPDDARVVPGSSHLSRPSLSPAAQVRHAYAYMTLLPSDQDISEHRVASIMLAIYYLV